MSNLTHDASSRGFSLLIAGSSRDCPISEIKHDPFPQILREEWKEFAIYRIFAQQSSTAKVRSGSVRI